jgi:drug/metabolite transporter (DMT)-like permease
MYLFIGVLSGLLWGINDVFTNILSSHILVQPVCVVIIFALLLAFFQDFSSFLAIMLYHKSLGGFQGKVARSRVVFKYIFIAAIFAGPLGMVCGIMGITYAGPVYASVITACYPACAMILSIRLLGVKPNNTKIAGVFLTILAMVCISIDGLSIGGEPHLLIGMFFALIAMIGWGLESVLVSKVSLGSDFSPSWLLGMRQMISSLSYLLILLLFFMYDFTDVAYVFSSINSIWLVLACIVSALFSYITYYNTIRNIGASLGTIFNSTFIFWAALISALLGITRLGEAFWYLAILLIFGVFLSFYDKNTLFRQRC